MDDNTALQPFTLQQLCRALAAHALLSTHPDLLQTFLAPETAEITAEIIYRFAMGEQMARPNLMGDLDG